MADPPTPAGTLEQLQAHLDGFRIEDNQHRPHRALGRRTPAAAYQARPKATPPGHTLSHPRPGPP